MSQETNQEKKVKCEVYSRIVGYLRPVQNWNDGKQQEYEERSEYLIPNLPKELPISQTDS